jgi:hypothetical protein
MSIQRGLGHWKIAPIKQLRSSLLPQALHLLDRREVYKTNQKINVPFAHDTAFRVGVRWVKARLQQEGKRVGCLHKRWLALLLFVVLAILHNVLIGLFVRLDARISVGEKVL